MRKFPATILFALLMINAVTQTNNSYAADLEKLYSILKKTPSFRDQVKGDDLEKANKVYDSLYGKVMNVSSDNEAFLLFVRLFFFFKDNHLGFYQWPNQVLSQQQYNDSAAIGYYQASKKFREYPVSAINTDSLQLALATKSKESIEGIYYYGNYLKVGVFKTSLPGEYHGVVLSTAIPVWKKGQIAIFLYEYVPASFRAVYGHPLWQTLILYNNEKFRNYSLVNSSFYSAPPEFLYKKNLDEADFINIPQKDDPFQFRDLSSSIQYVRLGNFSAMTSDMVLSEAFYERIKNSLTAFHLIVDLRNNTGGAEKVSKKFLKLFERFSKKGKIYVLVNSGTMSQGEIFTLQLKKVQNVRTYGQTTMGTLAYGSNIGKTEKLQNGDIRVYITDMRNKGYLSYENIGVTPDIILKNDGSWIEQVVQEIKKI